MQMPSKDGPETTSPDRAQLAAIYSVPASQPFLDCLAAALLNGDLPRKGGAAPSPVDLTGITLYLPTRRATRALQEAFLRAGGGRAMLLPKILPISEGDEELTVLAGAAGHGAPGTIGVGPAIAEMDRRLTLTKLVMRWSEAMRQAKAGPDADLATFAAAGSGTPAQAVTLAGELARLMDMVETENVSLDGLSKLVPELFSEHWQKTLHFLEIVTAAWPAVLAEKGLLSPVARRNALILAEARRLEALPPPGPVIVAGVTGSIPATVDLMRVVAGLPNGAIVLPALDQHLDEDSWQRIVPEHPEHPQFGLKKLLVALAIQRSDVAALPGANENSTYAERAVFIGEALRPSGTTGRWHAYGEEMRRGSTLQSALTGINLIEAPTAQDEAEAIALILRHAAETPGQRAALVSPDRLLARRVANRLEAWGIRVDDSAGRPFAKTVPGAFFELVIEAQTRTFAPAPLMALLKHPLTRLGLDAFTVRRAARALEIAVFRAPYLGEGLDGVEAALERAAHDAATHGRRHVAVRRLWAEDWNAARDLVLSLKTTFAPLSMLYGRGSQHSFSALAEAHVAVARSMARLPPPAGAAKSAEAETSPLWQGEAGETAQRFFAQLVEGSLPDIKIEPADYADFYRSLITGENVRPRVPVHPRLSIWGPFEARLQQTDVVILGSLNDGTWPEAADPGPWLNRPMRAELGLPSPEEKIGQAAHDFVSLLGSPVVILTRSEKVDGVPTVPSRWLLRMKALLDGAGASDLLAPSEPWLNWARQRNIASKRPTVSAPEPRPAVAIRPRQMSVSRVETWIANPYAIFAKEILELEYLDPIGQEPGAALRGSIIHEALSRFSKAHPSTLPNDTKAALIAFAAEVLQDYRAHPRIAAFWVPRFERFADWFAETEPARRKNLQQIVSETSGKLVIDAPAGPFTLSARADRIDVTSDHLVITDYKTGTPPTDKRVTAGISPQLPLEAAIALSHGFAHVPNLPVAILRYIKASGGEPPGEQRDVKAADIAALAAQTLDGLKRHIANFDDPETPYRPLRRPRFSYDYDPYTHLARVAEWSAGSSDGEEG